MKKTLSELGKDLYQWSKEKVQPIFSKRKRGIGRIHLKFHNKEITIWGANPYDEHFEDLWLEIPQIFEILKSKKLRRKLEYDARWDDKKNKWILKENNNTSKSRIGKLWHRFKWFMIHFYKRFPHDTFMIATAFLSAFFFFIILMIFIAFVLH